MEMEKQDVKRKIIATIDEKAQEIIGIGEDIFANPELGYKEFRTSGIVAEALGGLGLPIEKGLGITGVAARLEGKAPGPNINGQVAGMIGAAMGLVLANAAGFLSGKVTFLGVPAEEYVELEYRQKLREEGKIQFFGGKQELLAKGFFDDVDMAMMVHMGSFDENRKVTLGGTSNGFIGKLVKYKGAEAHAGGTPDMGVNALNAALLGLMAIHAQRETFRDDDHIRVHPIITKGGDLVNVIPADVRIETYVRGKTMEAIKNAGVKVNRALRAGASAIGAEVSIEELPGYLPRLNCVELTEVCRENASDLVGDAFIQEGGRGPGSSDIGDLMHIMPAIHPTCGGAHGAAHSEKFSIQDPVDAYILPAKLMALTVVDLLWDGAAKAKSILDSFTPAFTKDEYFANWNEVLASPEER